MKLAEAQAQGKLSFLDQAQVLTFRRFLEAAGERGSLQEPIELPPDLYNWALGRDAVPNLPVLTWPGHE